MASATAFLQLPDGRIVTVADGLTLGRAPACDVVVEDTKVSRRHARVVVEAGVAEIEDLDSSNGTLLNGKPVSRRVLRDGDVIQLGETRIVYHERTRSAGDLSPAASESRPAAAEKEGEEGEDVLEFADDDVVVVRKVPRPTPAATPEVEFGDVAPLRHARPPARGQGGLLADDLRQMAPAMRASLVLLVLAVGVAVGYLVMRLVSV